MTLHMGCELLKSRNAANFRIDTHTFLSCVPIKGRHFQDLNLYTVEYDLENLVPFVPLRHLCVC